VVPSLAGGLEYQQAFGRKGTVDIRLIVVRDFPRIFLVFKLAVNNRSQTLSPIQAGRSSCPRQRVSFQEAMAAETA